MLRECSHTVDTIVSRVPPHRAARLAPLQRVPLARPPPPLSSGPPTKLKDVPKNMFQDLHGLHCTRVTVVYMYASLSLQKVTARA